MRPDYEYKELHKTNMVAFLLNEDMDSALRFSLQRALLNARGSSKTRKLLKDPKLAALILEGL